MFIEAASVVVLLEEAGVPREIATMIIAMTPIFELRASIPIAITVLEMHPLSAYLWSVFGNVLPVLIIVFLLEKVSSFLSTRFECWKKFFDWLFARTRKRVHKQIEKYGDWGLFFLVAIPLPVTGGWTGALAAFLFGIKKVKAIPLITLGIMTAGVIVLLLTLGAIKL
ncbi:small multi-drug export protein [bacterium]|jgi:uncharacterized membrane protein|nr:small multi-drug export protein [bacterium]MBT4251445.1 small multi-drug export protein [bacterium]MBT4597419.1 small multi-drug export protein [bacterium]MBT6754258.1 small multi-drug export protein [bacterium]MBT7037584.1 small multi-drug export protein [bacterium]